MAEKTRFFLGDALLPDLRRKPEKLDDGGAPAAIMEHREALQVLLEMLPRFYTGLNDLVDSLPATTAAAATFIDNAVMRADGTGGSIQDSSVIVDDSINITLGTSTSGESTRTVTAKSLNAVGAAAIRLSGEASSGILSTGGGDVSLRGGAGSTGGSGGQVIAKGGDLAAEGDVQFHAADVLMFLGDAVGANKVSVKDSGNVEVFAVDSDGVAVGAPNVASELTISSGVITLPTHTLPGIWVVPVDTEADAASDGLDTVSGGVVGDLLILHTASSSRDVALTVAGNMKLGFVSPFTLSATTDIAEFVFTGSTWNARSLRNNG